MSQKWAKKVFLHLEPFGMLKQVIFARLERMVTHIGPWKNPKCLQSRPNGRAKMGKNGSKILFSKSDLEPFGMLKRVFFACFEPMVTLFGPWKIPKCLNMGSSGDQK